MAPESSAGEQISGAAVVCLDLARYREVTESLANRHRMGPSAVAFVQNQIKALIRFALDSCCSSWDECYIHDTGDGAHLLFRSADTADQFAECLHRRAHEMHNLQASMDLEHRCFRVGVFCGDVLRSPGKIHGTAVGSAARLEGRALTGEILVDAAAWERLCDTRKSEYGPEEQIPLKPHEKETLRARRRRVTPPAPWSESPTRDDKSPEENHETSAEALLAILEAVRKSSGVAKPPPDLEPALLAGRNSVASRIRQLAVEMDGTLTLGDYRDVASEAIHHGAGIYNHSIRGQVGCGEIYFAAATGLVRLGREARVPVEPFPTGTALAHQWLEHIVNSVGEITAQNGDDAAWELRYAFDSLSSIPQFDEITTVLHSLGRRRDVAHVARTIRDVVELSKKRTPTDAIYLLRHLIRLLQWLRGPDFSMGRSFQKCTGPVRNAEAICSRIVRSSIERQRHELPKTLVICSQNLEAIHDNHGILGRISSWLSAR